MMKNKKTRRSRHDSSSSSSDSSHAGKRRKSRSVSRSPSRNKHAKRSPIEDVRSKWDSPERKLERRKQADNKSSTREVTSSEKHRSGGSDSHRRRRDSDDKHKSSRQNNDSQSKSRYRGGSRSPNYNRNRSPHDRNRSSHSNRRRRRSRSGSFDHSKAVWGKAEQSNKRKDQPKDKEKPNFELTGALTAETNTYRGVVIKYSEPPEARKPVRRWRLYPFKGEKAMPTLYIHRESAYLIGRDRKVVDLPVDHPSCSKQHAALQYRLVQYQREDGSTGKRVRPYLIDLESANGTYINNKKIEPKKYVELLDRDVIKFGFSTREYVLLHENSKDDAKDDDVKPEPEPEPQPPLEPAETVPA